MRVSSLSQQMLALGQIKNILFLEKQKVILSLICSKLMSWKQIKRQIDLFVILYLLSLESKLLLTLSRILCLEIYLSSKSIKQIKNQLRASINNLLKQYLLSRIKTSSLLKMMKKMNKMQLLVNSKLNLKVYMMLTLTYPSKQLSL